ncbi:Glycosyltransferase, GT2 family [Butyrivibrio proteoclasticus]|uniref:Glycosyltransferase, GT2 family n=1 Tax=Butyrivibrio proteoclasticus TaxID=43305 RepID=A0A1I5X878_9FIRM|nr:glycosyltransferase family 2 protein [Butyrivibrio proteoclasticus]SFQ27857.1 Glycosyltransferase, GT2 family [Butyrivibrio proteoclasticus]
MGNNEVCAVVVTYNRKALVENCINGILAQRDAKCDIIVIDNGSTDGTEDLFREKYDLDNIRYFNLGENLGCAAGTSRGIKEAVLANYKYIWVMDDDVIPNEDTLYELLKADEELNGYWGILSSAAYWTDGSICESNRQKKTLFKFMKDDDYNKRFVRVCMVSLASMFIKAKVVKEVGLPLSEYFIYTEDYEFCSRVGKKYPIYVVPASKVTHAMKINRKANLVKDTPDRLYRYKHLYRNDVHCYRKLGLKGHLYLALKFVYTFTMVLLKEKEHKKEKLGALITGYSEGFKFKPSAEKIDSIIIDFPQT